MTNADLINRLRELPDHLEVVIQAPVSNNKYEIAYVVKDDKEEGIVIRQGDQINSGEISSPPRINYERDRNEQNEGFETVSRKHKDHEEKHHDTVKESKTEKSKSK